MANSTISRKKKTAQTKKKQGGNESRRYTVLFESVEDGSKYSTVFYSYEDAVKFIETSRKSGGRWTIHFGD